MTRRTQFNGTAASRRRNARQHLQALPVNDFSTDLSAEPAKPSKVELSCKRKPVSRVDKALSIPTEKHYPSADNICLPQVAIYSAGHRKSSDTVTAR